MISESSLRACENLRGTLRSCSYSAGWRSLLLRGYLDPPEVEAFTTRATPDQLIVLVTAGTCNIESYRVGQWHQASYRPGYLGMTSPGQKAKLRWRCTQPHHTLQLHLPASTLASVVEELTPGRSFSDGLPNRLIETDSVLTGTILALEHALESGVSELYAQTAAQFLAAHLLTQYTGVTPRKPYAWRSSSLEQVDSYLHAHLAQTVSLEALAEVADLSPFQLLRAAKAVWGETPHRRLTRLRMEAAKRLLRAKGEGGTWLPLIDVALECGYSNPSHFATAFRRHVGVSPSDYRRQ